MIERLTRKRNVLVLVLVAASVVLISGSRDWVSGSVDDAVLGVSALHGRGSEIAPGAMAGALVGLASVVAAATAGTVVRAIAGCATLLAAFLGGAVVISVLVDPGGALAALAAAGTGRSGDLVAHGRVGAWALVALAALLLMAVGALGSLVGARYWRGLSSRYEVPVAGGSLPPGASDVADPAADPAGEQAGGPESAASSWDQLSRGLDPTAEG